MKQPAAPICIQCGQPTTLGASDHFNRLSNGRSCPACAARLLETLPPLLPGLPTLESEREFESSEPDFDMPA